MSVHLHNFLHGHEVTGNMILDERRVERALPGVNRSPELWLLLYCCERLRRFLVLRCRQQLLAWNTSEQKTFGDFFDASQ